MSTQGKRWGRLGGTSLHVRLSPEDYQELLVRAREENKPMSEAIREAFRAYGGRTGRADGKAQP